MNEKEAVNELANKVRHSVPLLSDVPSRKMTRNIFRLFFSTKTFFCDCSFDLLIWQQRGDHLVKMSGFVVQIRGSFENTDLMKLRQVP